MSFSLKFCFAVLLLMLTLGFAAPSFADAPETPPEPSAASLFERLPH